MTMMVLMSFKPGVVKYYRNWGLILRRVFVLLGNFGLVGCQQDGECCHRHFDDVSLKLKVLMQFTLEGS